MARHADPRKQEHWLQHIRRWQQSRFTVREFCDAINSANPASIPGDAFCVSAGLLAEPIDSVAPRPVDAAAPGTPLFMPVAIADPGTVMRSIEIVLPDGLSVRVAAGFDAPTLRQLLALLRERPC